jgi:hypothetical protein
MDVVTNSSEEKLDLELLDAVFRTSKKTIQEYVREIERYCRFRSVRPKDAKNGFVVDDRSKLIDLYDACVQQDAHLVGTLETLKSQIIGERYMLCHQNDKGKYVRDNEETKKIQGTEFTKLIWGIVESQLYGYTGFEIMPSIDPLTGRLNEVNQIERRNIYPSQRRICQRAGIWNPGWSFDDAQYMDNYILIDTGGIGLFAATTPSILAKKFTMANYVNFSHTYGQPIIHGKAAADNNNDRKRLANDIASAASNKVIVTGLDDEIDIKTFTMSNSEHIFTGLIGMVDRDVSNLILGSESMAGATQSYVGATRAHQDIFRDRVEAYRGSIENVMNEQIIPRLVKMGFLKPGNEFKYCKQIEMSDEDQIKLYQFITERYEVSSDEIEKNFGIVVGRQLNINDGGYGGSVGGSTSDNDHHIMSDEEYYRRYGHHRGEKAVNFLRERR